MHTPIYKGNKSVKKRKLHRSQNGSCRWGTVFWGQPGWRWEGVSGGFWVLVSFQCVISGSVYHTSFPFVIICDIEYLCCTYFPGCLLYDTAIKAKETKLFSLCHRTMGLTETFTSYKIMGQGYRKKKCFQG